MERLLENGLLNAAFQAYAKLKDWVSQSGPDNTTICSDTLVKSLLLRAIHEQTLHEEETLGSGNSTAEGKLPGWIHRAVATLAEGLGASPACCLLNMPAGS